jgi:hypothetical protein
MSVHQRFESDDCKATRFIESTFDYVEILANMMILFPEAAMMMLMIYYWSSLKIKNMSALKI